MNEHEIPGYVTFSTGKGGLPKLVLETEWSTAEIYLHGAHVTAFARKGEPPLLFMSEESEFIEGKAIRGGVPLIFPWFGGRDGFPAHGYARISNWTLEESSVFSGGVMVRFRLPTDNSLLLEYVVRVTDRLSMELVITNEGEDDASFETCLHTYFQIGAIDGVSINGLQGCPYVDRLRDGVIMVEDEPFRFSAEVERLYPKSTAEVEILDPVLGRKIIVGKSGSHSTVVWNPWIEKSKRLPDFGDEEYLHMVCVESGNIVEDRITLSSGSRAVMKVEISSTPLG